MKLEYEMTPEILAGLDWIEVTDLLEETSGQMTVIDAAIHEDDYYLLVVEAEDGSAIPEDFIDDDQDTDEEAFLMKLVNQRDAQFGITEDYSDRQLFATTDLTEDEFNAVSQLLAQQADDEYDILIEGKERETE